MRCKGSKNKPKKSSQLDKGELEETNKQVKQTNFKPYMCSCIINKSLFKKEKVDKVYMAKDEKSATDIFMNYLIKNYTVKGKLKIKGLEIKEIEQLI